jgi:hypothetical protein
MLSSETLLNILDASGGNWQDHFAHKERMADSVTCMATVQDAVWVGTSQVITVPYLYRCMCSGVVRKCSVVSLMAMRFFFI